ncbi:MAG: hypothetical protein IK135_05480 [Bacteroidales bacterium]|nr:hypothetical protein [Bacteroidales bacterium]
MGVFAVVSQTGGEVDSVTYILKDHLGSWTTITDAEGNVEQELSYDAWGNLRDPDTWTNGQNALSLSPIIKCFV